MVDQSRDQPLLATKRKLSLSFDPVVSASTGFNFKTYGLVVFIHARANGNIFKVKKSDIFLGSVFWNTQ